MDRPLFQQFYAHFFAPLFIPLCVLRVHLFSMPLFYVLLP